VGACVDFGKVVLECRKSCDEAVCEGRESLIYGSAIGVNT